MKTQRRIADPIEGNELSYLEVSLDENGDAFVEVRGVDQMAVSHTVMAQFLSRNGGGYHPRTIQALYKLIEAMESDNEDLQSRKYRENL